MFLATINLNTNVSEYSSNVQILLITVFCIVTEFTTEKSKSSWLKALEKGIRKK